MLLTNSLAIALYLAAATILWLRFSRQQNVQCPLGNSLAITAFVAHAIGCYQLIVTDTGLALGFFSVSNLIFLVINATVLASSFKKPVHNLFMLLFPLTALALAASLKGGQTTVPAASLNGGLVGHILLSVVAYSLLTIASLQALLLAYENQLLKNHRTRGQLRLLPPLQTMEALLFELIWAGVIALTLAIATGFIFLDNIFAQQLVHKTVLAMVAWALFSTLLWGHHIKGWRGNTAVKWCLGAFIALMLAYFGSKMVLELIL